MHFTCGALEHKIHFKKVVDLKVSTKPHPSRPGNVHLVMDKNLTTGRDKNINSVPLVEMFVIVLQRFDSI